MVKCFQFGALCLVAFLATRSTAAIAQDAAAGERVFKTQCMVCHAVVPGKKGLGPNLHGVVGRAAGTVPDFHYSPANKNSGLTWDAATLDRYLEAPQKTVPGTTMTYAGLKNEAQRADVIAYLAAQQ